MTLVGRSCAIFDVDGTLLDGFIMPAFTRYLADHTVIDVVYADAMDDLLIAYRDGHVTYEAVGEKAPRIYARALQDRQQRDVQTLAARFMRRYISENAFRYAQPLVRRVTDLVDITVALSGAHQATIDPLKNWGFNHVHGSELSVERDRYTGDITSNLVLGSGKIAHVEKLCNEY